MNAKKLKLLVAVGFVGLFFIFGAKYLCSFYLFQKGNKALVEGYPAVAAHYFNQDIENLVKKDVATCEVVLKALTSIQDIKSMEFAAESCLLNGHKTVFAYLALARSKEFGGKLKDALIVLNKVEPEYTNSVDFYYGKLRLYALMKDIKGASLSFLSLLKIDGVSELVYIDALGFFLETNQMDVSRKIVTKLETIAVTNPELKLLMAKYYVQNNEFDFAKKLIAHAEVLLEKVHPTTREDINLRYADMFTALKLGAMPVENNGK